MYERRKVGGKKPNPEYREVAMVPDIKRICIRVLHGGEDDLEFQILKELKKAVDEV